MNIEQLKKNVGEMFRLRPNPLLVKRTFRRDIVLVTSGEPLFETSQVKTDYEWRLESVGGGEVTLHCVHTGHTITLGADNVRE